MMRMRCDFYAESLQQSTSMTVLLPQSADGQIGMAGAVLPETPVLYLLHGLSDDETCWERRSSVERYASEAGLAVVMPAVHRSFYSNEVHGEPFWDFVSDELPRLVAAHFKVATDREHTFVAGLSMGGYGALKLGLRHPERFSAIGAFSSAADLDEVRQRHPDVTARVWGDQPVPADDDIASLLRRVAPSDAPRLWLSCGTEDFLYDANRQLVDVATAAGHDPHVEWPAGEHEWDVWDAQIARFIPWALRG